jgi:hypothetical protein|tara:strand:+ start:86 stop:1036 length:951 start_codon:yes stop_codon:yes gene_type:complete
MKIHFNSGIVEIELLKNEFVSQWYNDVSKLDPIETWNENLFPIVQLSNEEIYHIRTTYASKFNAHVDELKDKHGLDFPGRMEIIMDQSRLNLLHKWVTHAAFTKSNWDLPNADIDDINNSKWNHWLSYDVAANYIPEFEIHDDDVVRILFEMNCDIHWYEETITSPRVTQLNDWGYNYLDGLHIIQRYTSGKDKSIDVFNISNEHRQFCTYRTDYDLWLPFAVLGKEYYTCWINMDNPSQFDITNIDKTYSPGWELQPNAFTNKVLAHNEFQDWLILHDVPTDAFCISKMPLGKCTNKHQLNFDKILTEQVLHVEW